MTKNKMKWFRQSECGISPSIIFSSLFLYLYFSYLVIFFPFSHLFSFNSFIRSENFVVNTNCYMELCFILNSVESLTTRQRFKRLFFHSPLSLPSQTYLFFFFLYSFHLIYIHIYLQLLNYEKIESHRV